MKKCENRLSAWKRIISSIGLKDFLSSKMSIIFTYSLIFLILLSVSSLAADTYINNTQINVANLCDENGNNCNDVGAGLGGGNTTWEVQGSQFTPIDEHREYYIDGSHQNSSLILSNGNLGVMRLRTSDTNNIISYDDAGDGLQSVMGVNCEDGTCADTIWRFNGGYSQFDMFPSGYKTVTFNVDNPSDPAACDPSMASIYLDSSTDTTWLFGANGVKIPSGDLNVSNGWICDGFGNCLNTINETSLWEENGVGIQQKNNSKIVSVGGNYINTGYGEVMQIHGEGVYHSFQEDYIGNPIGDAWHMMETDGGDIFYQIVTGDGDEGMILHTGGESGLVKHTSGGYMFGEPSGLHLFSDYSNGLNFNPVYITINGTQVAEFKDYNDTLILTNPDNGGKVLTLKSSEYNLESSIIVVDEDPTAGYDAGEGSIALQDTGNNQGAYVWIKTNSSDASAWVKLAKLSDVTGGNGTSFFQDGTIGSQGYSTIENINQSKHALVFKGNQANSSIIVTNGDLGIMRMYSDNSRNILSFDDAGDGLPGEIGFNCESGTCASTLMYGSDGGNIGIGLNSPNYAVDMGSATELGLASTKIVGVSGNYLVFGDHDGGGMDLRLNSDSDYISFDISVAGGQVGIWDTNRFNITTPLRVEDNISVNSGSDICIEGGNCLSSVGGGSGGWTDDGSVVRLTSSTDKVAIGTNNAMSQRTLTVEGNGAYQGSVFLNGTAPRVEFNAYGLTSGSRSYDIVPYSDALHIRLLDDGFGSMVRGFMRLSLDEFEINENNAKMNFKVNGDTTEGVFFINASSENIGISTENPDAKLDIDPDMMISPKGDISITLAQDGGDAYLETRSTDMSEGILMQGDGSTDSGVIRQLAGVGYTNGWTAGLHLFHDADEPIIISTNGSEKMRITGSGNVGIGMISSGEKLEVNGSILGSSNLEIGGTGSGTYPRGLRYNDTLRRLELWNAGLGGQAASIYIYGDANNYAAMDSAGTTAYTDRVGASNRYEERFEGNMVLAYEESGNVYVNDTLIVYGKANVTNNFEVGENLTIGRDISAPSMCYNTSWINNNDWTNQHLGTTVGGNVTHNLNANLIDLIVRIVISTDGTDDNAQEIMYGTDGLDSTNRGIGIFQEDKNNIKIQTAEMGLYYIQDDGTLPILDTENYYYKVKVCKLWG